MLIHHEIPNQWLNCNIVPFPKSGNLEDVGNYRGIALSAIAAKMTNKMILNRIQPHIDPILRPNQNGFRTGRSTTSHILALRRLIEGVKSHNLKAIIIFVDFKKAFDSINRVTMLHILEAYGIPEVIIQTIALTYKDTHAKVITPDGETKNFEITKGVLQGDTLAPFLFVITLDYAMRQAIGGHEEEFGFEITKKQSRRHSATILTDLSYADDIALVSQEVEQAQLMLTNIEIVVAKIGLHINANKTEIMSFNYNTPVNIELENCTAIVNVVNNFKYLGAWMLSSQKDFEIRKALSWSTIHKMKSIWKSKMNINLKIRTFKATIEPILLYGSECWTIDASLRKKIDGCYTRLLRLATDTSWKEKVTNVQLYKGLPKITDVIKERRLRLAGHCIRHNDEIAHNLILWTPKTGKRNRGRQPKTFVDILKNDCDCEEEDEIRSLMMDRAGWKKMSRSGRARARLK